jgi:hypothetical protein
VSARNARAEGRAVLLRIGDMDCDLTLNQRRVCAREHDQRVDAVERRPARDVDAARARTPASTPDARAGFRSRRAGQARPACSAARGQSRPATDKLHGAVPEVVLGHQPTSRFHPPRGPLSLDVESAPGTALPSLQCSKIRHYRWHCGHAASPAGAQVRGLMTHLRRKPGPRLLRKVRTARLGRAILPL